MGRRKRTPPHIHEKSRLPEVSEGGVDKIVLMAARKLLEYERQTNMADSTTTPNEVARRKAAKYLAEVHLVTKVLDSVLPMERETWGDVITDKANEEKGHSPRAS